jgi:hypothetical protein
MKLNGTYQLLVYIDDISLVGKETNINKINKDFLSDASNEVHLEANADRIKYTGKLMSNCIMVNNKHMENVARSFTSFVEISPQIGKSCSSPM